MASKYENGDIVKFARQVLSSNAQERDTILRNFYTDNDPALTDVFKDENATTEGKRNQI